MQSTSASFPAAGNLDLKGEKGEVWIGSRYAKERGRSCRNGVMSTPCPSLWTGLDSLKVENGQHCGRGEARASQKGSETTRALGLTSGNKMCPGLESRIFSLTLHRTLHELATQARQRSQSLAQTGQPVMNMGNVGFGEKHSRVLAMNRQLIFGHRSLKRTRQKPGILKLTDCSLGSHVQLLETPWTARQASLSFTVSQSLLKFMSTELMMPTISPSIVLFSSCLQSFPASGSFQKSQLFVSGGQSIEASASASVLPVNIQGWFPLGLTGLISLLSKGLSRAFSSTTVQMHQASL